MSRVIVVKYGARRAVIAAGLRGAPGSGGSAGVSSFNTRTGAVTLSGADVNTALGYTPANNASLAAVAFSGAYADLLGTPFIPTTPGDIGAATAAQGALADTAVQPAALTVQLDLKVDKVAGYGLSQENFTAAEKAKLAGLEGSHYRGTYLNLTALQTALPTAEPGDYADVDAGAADPVQRYIWDDNDGEWVAQAGSADPVTAAQVKTLYESNPDTNAFTDAEKSKLGGVAASANNYSHPNHTGDVTSVGDGALTIANDAVTNAKLANMATATIKGRTTAGTGDPEDLNAVQVRTILNVADGATANETDANLKDRANHTGSQATSTVTGLDAALAKALYAPVITEDTTARVLALTDGAAYIRHTNASASTVTIPPQSSVVWLADTEIHIRRAAAGNLTLTPGSGVTLNAPSGGTLVLTNGMSVTLKRVVADVWDVIGQTVAA